MGESPMQNSSAGILMKSLKNKPQRGHSDFVWLTLRIDKLFALFSGRAPPGAGLWQAPLWEVHCEINYREKC